MLNRRFLRAKVMQILYSYYQSGETDIAKCDKELFNSIQRCFDLSLYMLCLIPEIVHVARLKIEIKKEKRLPTQEDLNPNLKFVDNRVIGLIENNVVYKRFISAKKIHWNNEHDVPKKLFKIISESNEYQKYMDSSECSFKQDKAFVLEVFRKYIADDELIHFLMEEMNIHWYSDIEIANSIVQKVIEGIKETTTENSQIFPELYKDNDDKKFIRDLLTYTIQNDSKFEKYIADKTDNWEIERIALLDVILMKMALTELVFFSSVPVKVSINEYIELSKNYSTLKSKSFINGILDRLAIDLKQKGEILKTGRGLLDA